jgi:hypothetical protein
VRNGFENLVGKNQMIDKNWTKQNTTDVVLMLYQA